MSSIDPSASEIGDLKIVSKVKSMFEVKPDNDVQYVKGKKSKPEPVQAPVVETNGLVDTAEEKQTEVVIQEVVVNEEKQPIVEEKPEAVVEEKPQPVVEEKPEEKVEEKHVTFNEENPAVITDEKTLEKPESESKEAPAKNDLQNDVSEPKETNQNQ